MGARRKNSFFKNLFNSSPRMSSKRKPKAPTFDLLEDRTTPATITGGTGPGGIEAIDGSSQLEIWLDATDIFGNGSTPADNDVVSAWQDKSGKDRDFDLFQDNPNYVASGTANGMPAVNFDGNDYLRLRTDAGYNPREFINASGQMTLYSVARYTVNGDGKVIGSGESTDADWSGGFYNGTRRWHGNGWGSLDVGGHSPDQQWRLHANMTNVNGVDPNSSAAAGDFWQDGFLLTTNGTGYGDSRNSFIPDGLELGASFNGQFSQSEVSELIMYNRALNNADNIMVQNYLSSKYDITLTSIDRYAGDTVGNGNFDSNVFGIGRVNAANQRLSSGQSGFGIEATSIGDDGDFVLAGHKVATNAVTSSGVPNGINQMWTRSWFVDVTDGNNNLGATLAFDYSDAGLSIGSATAFRLLRSLDGGATFVDVGVSPTQVGDTVKFNLSAAQLSTGVYTLATAAPSMTLATASFYYSVGDGAVVIDSTMTVADPAGATATITGATVAIQGFSNGNADVLGGGTSGPFTGSYDNTTGILTLTGSGTVAELQAALRTVTFSKSVHEGVNYRTLTYTLQSDLGSNTQTRQAIIAANAPANVTWDGGGDGESWSDADNWSGNSLPDINDTAVFANVDPGVVNVDGEFSVGALSFTGTSSGFTIAAAGGSLTLVGATALTSSSTQTNEIQADVAITQNGVVTKTGSGTLTFNNVLTGEFTANVSGGILNMTDDSPSIDDETTLNANSGGTIKVMVRSASQGAGGATLTANGGTLQFYLDVGAPTSPSIANPVVVSANSTLFVDFDLTSLELQSLSSSTSAKLLVDTNGTQTVTITGGTLVGSLEIENADLVDVKGLSGAGGLTKSGAGVMRMIGDNYYSGPTLVSAGTLKTPEVLMPVTTNMSAWYDASYAPSIHLSGSVVTQWDDRSGNNHHGTALYNPTSTTYDADDGPNGTPVVQFRASSLQLANAFLAKETYIVLRSAYNSTQFWNDWSSPFGAKNNGDHYNGSWMIRSDTEFWTHGPAYPSAVLRDGVALSPSNNYRLNAAGNVDQYFLLMVDQGSSAAAALYAIGNETDWHGGYFDIAEVIAYDTVLSATDQARVGGYLETKYGINTTYSSVTDTIDAGGNFIPDASAVTVSSGGTLDISSYPETIGSLTVNGTGVVTLAGTGELTTGPVSGTGGSITVGANALLTIDATTTASYAGTVNLDSGATLTKQGASDQTLTNAIEAIGPEQSTISINSTAGSLNLDGGVHLQGSGVTFGGAGNVAVGGAISGTSVAGLVPNQIQMFGYHTDGSDPPSSMNLHNNGGAMGGGDPTAGAGYYGSAIVTNGPLNDGIYFNDDSQFIATGAVGQNDNYTTLFLTTLHVSAADAGNWEFRMTNHDDRLGMWIDLDQDGVFESTGGFSSNANEQLSWNDGGTYTRNLAAGDYLVAFTHHEFGGGSQIRAWVKSPTMGGQQTVNPTAPSQAGYWNVFTPTANNVVKTGSGTLTLSGANTYAGDTTVNAGQVTLGASNTLPDTTDLTVNAGTLAIGASSDTVASVTLVTGSITGSTGVLSSATDFELNTGTISAILGGSSGLLKSGGGVVTLTKANTYSGATTINSGILVPGVADAIPSGAGKGNVAVNGAGILELNGLNTTVNGLSGDGTIRSTVAGAVTLTVGANDQSSTFQGNITDQLVTPVSGIQHYGYHAGYGANLNLNGNGGMMNGNASADGSFTGPLSYPNFNATYVLTSGPGGRGLDFDSDADFQNSGAIGAGRDDTYSNLFLTTLHVTAATAGVWTFREPTQDDVNGMWIDLNQDGVFGVAGGGLGTGGGGAEQLAYGDGGFKSVTLAEGDYLMAFTHGEGGGGSQIEVRFTNPVITTETMVKPSDPAQSGYWFTPSYNPTGGAGGGTVSLLKTGTGTLTMGGASTYSGSTTVSAGTLQLASFMNGVVAQYSFDDSGNLGADSGPNANNLTDVTGSPTYSASGKFGGAVQFSPNSSLNATTFPTGVPTSGASYTISAWVNPTNGNGGGGWIGWGNLSNSQSNSLRMDGNGTILNYWYSNDLSVSAGQDMTTGTAPAGWHHVVAVYNSNSTVHSIYVDGVLRGSRSASGLNAAATNFRIGATSASEYFLGLVDQVTILNRAVSANEIAALYASASGVSASILPIGTTVTVASGATFDVNGGAQQIASLAGPSGSSVDLGSGQLTFGGSGTGQFDGVVSGAGGLVRAGTGTQILNGDDSYSGTTTVSSGTLEINGTQTGGGAVTVTGSGTLVGEGTLPGAFSVANPNSSAPLVVDGTLDPGAAGGFTGTLTVGSMTFNANVFTVATLRVDLIDLSDYDQVWVNDLTLGNTTTNFYPILDLAPIAGLDTGDYMIIKNTSSNPTVGRFAGLAEGQLFSANGQTFSITYQGGTDSNDVILHNFGAVGTIYVDPSFTAGPITDADPVQGGNQGATFGVNAFNTITDAISAASSGYTIIVNPGTYHEAVDLTKTVILYLQQGIGGSTPITFDSLASATGVSPVVQLNNGVSLIVGDSSDTTLNHPIIGVGSLTKVGSGTLTLSAVNGYNGTTTISDNGALRTGVESALPGGTITIASNARLQLGGVNQAFIGLAGTGTIENASTVSDATLTFGTGGISGSFAGVLADGAGTKKLLVSKVGAGTVTLAGSSTYSGATSVTGGIMRAGAFNAFSPNSPFTVTAPGKVQLYGYDNTILSAAGTGVIENGSESTATLTFSSSGVIASSVLLQNGSATSVLAVAKAGTGVLTVTGTNTYSGGTSIQQGIVVAGSAGAIFGTGVLEVSGTLQLAGRNVSVRGLAGGGIVENEFATDGTLTVTGGATTYSGVLRDGSLAGKFNLHVANPDASTSTPGAITVKIWQNHTFPSLENDIEAVRNFPLNPASDVETTQTTQIHIPDNNTLRNQVLAVNPASTFVTGQGYTVLWLMKFTPDVSGQWNFKYDSNDNEGAMWMDYDQDGVFEIGAGERFNWQNTGESATQNLTAGQSYLFAVAARDYENGSFNNFRFRSPAGGATNGDLVAFIPANYPTVIAAYVPAPGSLTLSGNNTYTGTTTVASGTLIAGSTNALGSTSVGTSVLSGATLGFSGSVSVAAETVTINGSGAPTRSGALDNFGGSNTFNGVVELQHVDLGAATIGSTTGTLILAGDVHLNESNVTFNGSGNVTVNGVISGNLSGADPASPDQMEGLALWLDASDINGNGTPYTRGSVSYWHDKSGNNHDLMYVVGHNAQYVASSTNGKPAVAFDGSNALGLDFGVSADNPQNFILDGGLNPNGQYTFVTVARYTSAGGRVFNGQQGTDWFAGFHGSYVTRWHAGGYGSENNPNAISNTNWQLHAMQNNIYNDTNDPANNYYLNGVLRGPAASRGTTDNVINNIPNGLQLGAGFSTPGISLSEASQSQVSEVLMFNRVLSTLELQDLQRWLNNKYDFNSASLDAIPSATNSVIKTGTGSVAFNGANTYSGDTTVNGGRLVAGHVNALGTPTVGTVVNSGGTLGLQNDVTIAAEAVTISGTGAAGQGALANVSGSNAYNGALTLAVAAPNFDVGIGSNAGTLTVGTPVNMGTGNLVFSGAGDVVVTGVVSGSLNSAASSPVMSNMTSWFDASNTGSVHFSSGTTVSQWDDLSGNNHHATPQYNPGNTQYVASGGPNDAPVIQFRQSSLELANPLNTKETYIVFRSAYSANQFWGDWSSPFGGKNNGDHNQGAWMISNGNQFWGHGPAYPSAVKRNGISLSSSNNYQLNAPLDQYFIMMVDQSSSAASTLYSIGNATDWHNGYFDIAEIITYDTVLSAANQDAVHSYLGAKYRIGVGDNSVSKIGTGTVTLTGNNSYLGDTTITGGALVAGHNNALGTLDAGTTVAGDATLGFKNGVTIDEALTVGSGLGAAGMEGALTNISGDNVISASSSITHPQVYQGIFSIGSLAGKLTIDPDVDLLMSRVVADGAGNVRVNGDFFSSTPEEGVIDARPQHDMILNTLGALSLWDFNQTTGPVTDLGTAHNNGTMTGGSTRTTGRTGGVGDYAFDSRPGNGPMTTSTVDSMYQAIADNDQITLGFWLWQDPTFGYPGYTTFEGLDNGGRVAFTHAFHGDNIYWDAGNNYERVNAYVPTNDFTDGWHQYILTKSSNGAPDHQAIYRDGVLLVQGGGSQDFGLIDFVRIAENYRGRLDDVFLLPTYLDQTQVTDLWDARDGFLLPDNRLDKYGSGELRMYGNYTYTGDSTAHDGILGGTGTFTGNVIAIPPGTLDPGSSPGVMTTGNLTILTDGKLRIDLNGGDVWTPGNPTNSYDRMVVNGAVNLGTITEGEPVLGAQLELRLGYVPVDGTIYKIVDNDGSSDPVDATFFGLAEQATITATYGSATYNFRISYVGGDGNDITLTNFSLIPYVTGVTPFVGPTSGGNVVIITGTGFSGVAGPGGVTFTGTNATSYTVLSNTEISAVVPSQGGNPSLVDVRVTSGSITSDNTSADNYTYQTPQISSISPNGVAFNTLTNATWSVGNPTVTVASTAVLHAGDQLSSTGNGFPAHATVLAVVNATTFTLNTNPTGTQVAPTTIQTANAATRTGTVLTLSGATWLNGLTSVTVDSTENLKEGQYLTAPGLPSNAVVASITGSTTFELNVPAFADQFTPTTIAVADAVIARDQYGNLAVVAGSSVIQHLVVTFNQKVTLEANAFSIVNLGSSITTNSAVPVTGDVAVVASGVPGSGDDETGYSKYVLNFVGGSTAVNSWSNSVGGAFGNAFTTLGNSLYQLQTVGSMVHAGTSDTAANSSDNFWTLYGVANPGDIFVTGTAGGGNDEVRIDGIALTDMYATFGSDVGVANPPYSRPFDRDLDGDVDGIDLTKLYFDFGTIWSF